MRPLALGIVALLFNACAFARPPARPSPTAVVGDAHARVAQGRLRGVVVHNGIKAFRGIPYRAPPTRFERAGPPVPWTGVRDAARPGPACPQPATRAFALQSEDCLSVDVWTPDVTGERPVLVFVHGGGWTYGGTRDPVLDGTRLARTLDAVVVTVNHRLGVLGWSRIDHLGGSSDAANLGLLDLTDALFWVDANIAALGGDPDNITIAGASAGGAAVVSLMGFAPAKGAFQRAVAMSGAGARVRFRRHAARVTRAVMDAAGVGDLAALRRLPLARLMKAQEAVTEAAMFGDALFGPVVDGHRVRRAPLTRLAAGASADVPLLIGTTRHEARVMLLEVPLSRWLTPSRLFDALPTLVADLAAGPDEVEERYEAGRPRANGNELALAMITDAMFRLPAVRTAEGRAARGGATYVYRFDWHPRRQDEPVGAAHGIDVPVLFGTRAPKAFGRGVPPKAMVTALHRDWASFVHGGRPADPAWSEYLPGQRIVRLWRKKSAVVRDPHGAERRLWEGLPFDGTGPGLLPAVPQI